MESKYVKMEVLVCMLWIVMAPVISAPCFPSMYSFGDSLTDTGNALIAEPLLFRQFGSPPYGNTFFHHPTGRCSDGRLVIDFLATAMGLPFLQPYLQVRNLNLNESGVNFAVAGATALDPLFFLRNGVITQTPLSLNAQVQWFAQYKKARCAYSQADCQDHFSKSLYVMGEIGANDYIDSTVFLKPLTQLETFTPRIIDTIHTALQTLIEAGARKILVQGIPPIGCSPAFLTLRPSSNRADYDANGCLKSYNQFSQNHNSLLQRTLQQLRDQHPEVALVYADYYAMALDILTNHTNYGFVDTAKACCGRGGRYNFDMFSMCGVPGVPACPDSSKYTNWDGIHLTEATYKVVTQLLFNQSKYTQPPISSLIGNTCQVQSGF